MKNILSRGLVFLGNKLGVYRFTARYCSDYPKMTRLFNKGLPIAMVVGVLIGLGVLSWQIAGLARDGEVRISAPAREVAANFEAQMVIKASQDRQPYHLSLKLDNTTIETRVGTAIKKDDVRSYKFTSGVNGQNAFNVNLLKPGKHTLTARAATGTVFGQGTKIDEQTTEFVVKSTNNLAAMDEPIKTFKTSEVANGLGGKLRSAYKPTPADLAAVALEKVNFSSLSSLLVPKAEAHSGTGFRHGHIKVTTKLANSEERVAHVPIQVGHPVLGLCHEGNARTTDGAGVALFTNCPVSNNGGSEATYAVHALTTPPGYTIAMVHNRTMTVRHAQINEITYLYTKNAPAPAAPIPAAPAPVAAPSYDFTPGDKPMIAVTALTPNAVAVDAFAMKMVNNTTINNLREVVAYVDGARVATLNSFGSVYATQAGLLLNLPGVNLADGQPHKVAVQVVTNNNQNSIVNVNIIPDPAANPNPNGTGGTPAETANESPVNNPHKGSIAVSVYAHSNNSVDVNDAKDPRVGAVSVAATNIGSKVGQCGNRQNGLTDNDRGNKENFGRIKFTDCPAALQANDNHAKKYRITVVVPDGFEKPGGKILIEREVTVKKDEETKVNIVLVGNNNNTIKPVQPSAPPAAPGSTSNGTGGTPFPPSGPNASGVMMLYSEKGRYNRAMISIDTSKGPTEGGVPNALASCGGILLSGQPNQRVIVTLPESSPRKIRCSSSSYFVNFFKHDQSLDDRGPQNNNPRVSPSISSNHCTHVHRSGISQIVPIDSNGSCSASSAGENVTKEDAVLSARYRPFPIIIGQSYTYEHELKLKDGTAMSPVECAGDINIIHLPLNDPGRRYPIRYNPATKTCTFKQQVSKTYSAKLKPKTEQLKLVFDGNNYLKPITTVIEFDRKRL